MITIEQDPKHVLQIFEGDDHERYAYQDISGTTVDVFKSCKDNMVYALYVHVPLYSDATLSEESLIGTWHVFFPSIRVPLINGKVHDWSSAFLMKHWMIKWGEIAVEMFLSGGLDNND